MGRKESANMVTKLRNTTAADTLADVIFETHTGLASDPQTQDLAGTWHTFLQKADGLATRSRETIRAGRAARARLRLADLEHDAILKRLNRAATDAADGNKKSTLVTQFFGTHSVSEITHFGIQREITESKRIIAILQGAAAGTPTAALAERFAAPLSTAVDAMSRYYNERAENLQKRALLQVEKRQMIEDFNREFTILEGALLQKFPDDKARVIGYLTATQPIESFDAASDAANDADTDTNNNTNNTNNTGTNTDTVPVV